MPFKFSRHPWASAASAALLAGQAFHTPALRDGATGAYLTSYSLRFPLGHLLTTPFSTLADMVTYNSARQDKVLVVYLLLGYWIWRLWRPRPLRRAIRGYAAYLAGVLAFLAWAILVPRPAARLAAHDPEDLVVDFHSHTLHSWDARKTFSVEANRRWHRRMGYDAAFITDHNVRTDPGENADDSASSCPLFPGEELSLRGMHVLALGNEKTIDHSAYDKSLEDLRRFLRYSSRRRVPALLCLTEDWKNHPAEQWEEFAKSGAAGFEIVNASPKGLDFPDELKRAAVETGRRRGLLLIGGSDNHGWGSAAYVWNVMRVPGYQAMPEAVLRSVVLETLKKDPADAVEVVTRVKADPLPGAWNWLDPPRGLWVLLSALTWAQTFVSLAWVWALSLGARKMHALF